MGTAKRARPFSPVPTILIGKTGPSFTHLKKTFDELPIGACSMVPLEKGPFRQLTVTNLLDAIDNFVNSLRKSLRHPLKEYRFYAFWQT